MSRRPRLPALCAAALLATLLTGCASTTLEAYQGDYGAQFQMYVKNAALQPDGRLADPVRAEYWLQQMVAQRAEFHSLYAAGLLDGRFGHIDEARALAEAQAAPLSNKNAQEMLASVAKLKDATAKDFPAWQALYAETRPLCPDRYPRRGSPLDGTLAMARHGARYDPLPDAIQPGMANVHAYLLLVQTCPFSLAEQLDDPKVYAVRADWYGNTVTAEPKKATALRALAQRRFPATGMPAATADAQSLAQVREDILARYRALYAAHLADADQKVTAECTEALLPVADAVSDKRYADLVKVADQAAASACGSGFGHAMADADADLGLSHDGNPIAAITRGIAFLKDDSYDADMEDGAIANILASMDALGSWIALDDLVTTLKVRYPEIQPLKL